MPLGGAVLSAAREVQVPILALLLIGACAAKAQRAAAARSIALINAVGNLGSGFGPYWIGHLRDTSGSFRTGLLSVAAMLTLAGLIVLFADRGSGRQT